ncbi:MAG: hypothetical protein H6574_23190 [Lewinellaceae bacterium]|nr:hypothetical protein [Lewinellaceae bacterium]
MLLRPVCLFQQVVAIAAIIAAFSLHATANYTVSTTIPTDISACQDTVFTVTLSNPGPAAQAAGSLQYCLPEGLQYVSVTGLNPSDLSDPRCPVFTLPALAANGSLSFELRIRVGCAETDRGDLRDTMRIVSGGVPQPILLGSAYNIRVPVITLLPGQNWNYTGAIGEIFTRTFVLRNEGFGAAVYLFLIDSFQTAGLELVQTTGVFQGDTLVLKSGDLGPKGALGYQDSVVVTQTFRITDCNSQTMIVSYGWACPDSTVCALPRFEQYQISGANSPTPVLVAAVNNAFQTPRPCEFDLLEIRVENTGNAAALDIDWLEGFLLDPASTADGSIKFDCFPVFNFRVAGIPLVDSSGGSAGLPYRLSLAGILSDPDGPGGLSDEDGDGQFDDLAPGSSVLLQCLVELDPDCKPCNGLQDMLFLAAQLRYSSSCGASYTSNLAPNIPLDLSFVQNVFLEDHPFILDAGTTYDFHYDLDATFKGLRNVCPNDSIILKYSLPEVLELPAGFQPTFDSMPVPFWVENDTLVYLLLPDVVGVIDLPIVPVCPPDIDDSAICSPPFEPRTYALPADLYWVCGNGCDKQFDLVCLSGLPFTIDCPRPDDTSQQHGVFADTIWVQRLSLGYTDNVLSAQVDPATAGLQLDIGIPYDTVQIHAEARFEGMAGDVFDSTQLQVYYWNGVLPYFLPLSATLTVEDAESGITTSCPDIPLEYIFLNGYHIWQTDLQALFQPGGCLAGSGIQFTPGDRLKVDVFARLTEDWPYLEVEEVKDLRVRFPYIYHGDSLLCKTKNAFFQGIYPDIDYAVRLEFPDTVCHNLKVQIDFVQGRSGRIDTDLFPFEIRPLYVYDSLWVLLQPGYAYQPGSAVWEYEAGDGATAAPVPMQLPLADPDPVVLPGGAAALLFLRPPQLPVTDFYTGRAEAVLRFEAQALCPPDTTKLIAIIAGHRLLATLDSVNVQLMPQSVGSPDFNELIVTTFSNLSSSREPTWLVEYCNPGPAFSIETPLLWLEIPPGLQLLTAVDITDPAAPQPLPITPVDNAHATVEGLFLGQDACRTIELKTTIQDCVTGLVLVQPAIQCDSTLPRCLYAAPLELVFSPKISLAQINVSSSPDTAVDLCAPIDYALRVVNVGDGLMYDLEVSLQLPPAGQTLVPGSASIEYNGQQVPLPDPAPGPNGLTWTLNLAQLPFGIEALPGILFVQSNTLEIHFQLETNCDYIDGTRFLYACTWSDACGGPKNTSLFVAPPLQIKGAPTATNTYQMDVTVDNPASFCAENTVQVRIVNPGDLGPTTALEKVRIVLPASFSYVPGSLTGIHNDPVGPPVLLPFGDVTFLSVGLPPGVLAGDSVVFSFKIVNNTASAICQLDYDFGIQMTQTANIACANASCAIDFVLLEDMFSMVLQKPSFALSGLTGLSLPLDAGLENWQLDFQLENISGISGGGSLQVEVRLDENQNAQLDPADPLLQTLAVSVEGLQSGGSLPVGINVDVSATSGCSGIWVSLVDTLCSCTRDSVFIPFVRLKNAGDDQIICAGAAAVLGFPGLDNALYEWIPASPYLSGTTVPDPVYEYTGAFAGSLQFSEVFVLKTTRAQGCISYDTIQVTTRKVELELSPTPVLCHGDSTGSVLATIQGAADTVQFTWSTSAEQTAQLDSLTAGNYALTVSDFYGCTDTAAITVTEPPALDVDLNTADFNGYDISCAGASDGSLTAIPSGGVGGYQFAWSPNGTGPELTALPAGTYTLTLTDANGCFLIAEASLLEPDTLQLALAVTDEVCLDAANGLIAVQVQGGVAPYSSGGMPVSASFEWSGLAAGPYTVEVTDANGCMAVVDTSLATLFSSFTASTDSVTCFGAADGFAEITGLGYPPFDFNWSSGNTGAAFNGPAGVYTCTVTDMLGCTYILETAIEEPALLLPMAGVEPVGCFGDSTGQIALSASGGISPYTFLQNGQPVGPVLSGLPAGLYIFSIVDGNGCVAALEVPLDEPLPLTMNLVVTDARCFESNTGQVDAQPNGGTPDYTLAWSSGLQGLLLDSVPAGWYVATLTDAGGCMLIDSAFVGQPAPYMPEFVVLELPCADRANGSLSVSGFPDGTRFGLNRPPFQDISVFDGVGGGMQLLEVEDSLGCRFEFAFDMPAYPEFLGEALADTVMHIGDSAWLRVVLPQGFPAGAIQHVWLNPIAPLSACDTCASLWVRPEQTAAYAVQFSTASGCLSESRVVVQIVQDSVYAPNVLYEGALRDENRFFTLFAREGAVQEIRVLRIFDRWGTLVFERSGFLPNDYVLGWDGRFRSADVLPGVFVWYAEVEFAGGRVMQLKGDLTVLR